MTRQPENQIFGFQAETFAKPQNNSLVLGFSLFQHKHNKIKQNNHTNPTITAHFQAVKNGVTIQFSNAQNGFYRPDSNSIEWNSKIKDMPETAMALFILKK